MTESIIFQMDATAFLKAQPAGSVDLILTDPAYESLEKHRKIGTTTRLKANWFPIFPNARYPELLAECYRVLRRNSHFYCFCDQPTMLVLWPLLEQAGFKVWKFLVWDKQLRGMGYHYPAAHELILFAEKGKRKLTTNLHRDVIPARAIRKKGAYPTEKPVSLLELLISESTAPGDLVLDPFCGSGATGEAALNLGRRFMGADVSEHAISQTLNRLQTLRGIA